MANEKKEFTELRAEIIKLDDAIVELLDARADVSQRIGEVKRQLGLNLVDRMREQVVYEHATSHPRILSKSQVHAIYKEIIAACRAIQTV